VVPEIYLRKQHHETFKYIWQEFRSVPFDARENAKNEIAIIGDGAKTVLANIYCLDPQISNHLSTNDINKSATPATDDAHIDKLLGRG